MEITYTLPEIDAVAKQVWEAGKHYKIWAFYASMGSGKTTFIHALCALLEVEDVVSSPTYTIMNEYKSKVVGTICHTDWYKLKDENDAIHTGVEDAIYTADLSLIEWPEKAEGLLEKGTFKIAIEVVDITTRRLTTSAHE